MNQAQLNLSNASCEVIEFPCFKKPIAKMSLKELRSEQTRLYGKIWFEGEGMRLASIERLDSLLKQIERRIFVVTNIEAKTASKGPKVLEPSTEEIFYEQYGR